MLDRLGSQFNLANLKDGLSREKAKVEKSLNPVIKKIKTPGDQISIQGKPENKAHRTSSRHGVKPAKTAGIITPQTANAPAMLLENERFWDENEATLRPDIYRHVHGKGEAPNDRTVNNVRGCAQPTIKGVKEVLDDEAQKGNKVVWLNLRREPAVYIENKSYALKKNENIKINLDYPDHFTPESIDLQEQKLKEEILEKTSRGENLYTPDMNMDDEVLEGSIPAGNVKPENVKTVKEVFTEIKKEYPNLAGYYRMPIVDNRKPKEEDFDNLVRLYKDADPKTTFVANCQEGMGRTTTAMVVYDIMNTAKNHPETEFSKIKGVREQIKEEGQGSFGKLRTMLSAAKVAEFSINRFVVRDDAGDYHKVIQEQGKAGCDFVKEMTRASGNEQWVLRGYAERYLFMGAFFQYCKEQSPKGYEKSFTEWIKPYDRKLEIGATALQKIFLAEAKLKEVRQTVKNQL